MTVFVGVASDVNDEIRGCPSFVRSMLFPFFGIVFWDYVVAVSRTQTEARTVYVHTNNRPSQQAGLSEFLGLEKHNFTTLVTYKYHLLYYAVPQTYGNIIRDVINVVVINLNQY